MTKYSVLLRGEDFELTFEDELRLLGFYTTRVVKADSEEDAENIAVALINQVTHEK